MTTLTHEPPESPTPHRFTREEYYHLLESGLFEGRRVELIEGEIIDMAAMKDLHAVAVGIISQTLGKVFPGCWVRCQLPLSFIRASDPEPDFAVVPGSPRDYKGKGHPATALLVVEIADTSLRFDRGTKAALYARAGIVDYWIVNLNDGQIEVHRNPEPAAGSLQGFKYASISLFRAGDLIVPLAQPAASIPVADLLP